VSGGATGIGAATVQYLHVLGVKVVFGDINTEDGEKTAKQYPSQDVKFIRTDVTEYQDHIGLFDLALLSFGRVDFAISNAGAMEAGNFVNPHLSLEEIKKVDLEYVKSSWPGANVVLCSLQAHEPWTSTFLAHCTSPE
jgi:NAD(P)-dependent dehydrogenase (short-subunit alcohol dehydrogenase family)